MVCGVLACLQLDAPHHQTQHQHTPHQPHLHDTNHKGHHPRHKTAKDGTPLIRNKNGAYVVDQKKVLAAASAGKDSDKSKDSAKSQDLELVLTAMNDNAAKLVDETVKSTVRALFTQTPPDDAST